MESGIPCQEEQANTDEISSWCQKNNPCADSQQEALVMTKKGVPETEALEREIWEILL